MNWYENLYVGKNAKKKAASYIRKIEDGNYPLQIYLITFTAGAHDQIEIISPRNLKFWYHQKKNPMIAGIALGREEALEVLQQMVQDIMCETGGLDFRQFFLSETGQTDIV